MNVILLDRQYRSSCGINILISQSTDFYLCLNHERKDSVDKHIKIAKHIKNKTKSNNSNLSIQKTLLLFENTLNEREKINKEVVEAFTYADIPLEKIEKLRPFLLKHCNNGINL